MGTLVAGSMNLQHRAAGSTKGGPRTIQGHRSSVLVADDHPVIRMGIGQLLQRSGFEVVAEAGDGAEAVRLTLETCPDIALLDVVMPAMGGLEATRRIVRECPRTRVAVISGQVGDEHVAGARAAGAVAFIAKGGTFKEISEILYAVREGRPYTGCPEAGLTFDGPAGHAHGPMRSGEIDKLTAREREVLRLVAQGHSSVGVASQLGLSVRTIETHRQNIMSKLGIHSMVGLTRFAVDNGLE
jgi:DNA-binding NarL/FixJ family response regulator